MRLNKATFNDDVVSYKHIKKNTVEKKISTNELLRNLQLSKAEPWSVDT